MRETNRCWTVVTLRSPHHTESAGSSYPGTDVAYQEGHANGTYGPYSLNFRQFENLTEMRGLICRFRYPKSGPNGEITALSSVNNTKWATFRRIRSVSSVSRSPQAARLLGVEHRCRQCVYGPYSLNFHQFENLTEMRDLICHGAKIRFHPFSGRITGGFPVM